MKASLLLAATLLIAPCLPANAQAAPAAAATQTTYAALDSDFERWRIANHVPGMVWGVVIDGKLVHVKALGQQTVGQGARPVTADTGFRIASMSKAFTAHAILRLRDEGRLRLDDPVWKYIPEVKRWGADITIADLLHHTAGFVTDDPWGDRQQPMAEMDFTRLLKTGVPRTAPRGTRFEYSNLGYAMLGRVISNVTGMNFSKYVSAKVFTPLGMAATTYENADVPSDKRAIGYRWEDNVWLAEPYMTHGAFGAMGGITTSANDYARWLGFLLSAWPASDTKGPASAVRSMQYGGGLPQLRGRPGTLRSECKLAAVYGGGLIAAQDCALGQVLYHGGGFPGYGSHMLLIPDAGVAVFAMTNKTYTGASGMVWDAATRLGEAGLIRPRGLPTSAALSAAYGNVRTIWNAGSLQPVPGNALAMNFLLDRDGAHWQSDLAQRKAQAGDCDTSAAIVPTGALSGTFSWACTKGTITGSVLLAPTKTPSIQALVFDFASR
jgi:D-alanyl-D-alanine-carboxypeptidase/D-alanyl-D-alanine-endopeptidase